MRALIKKYSKLIGAVLGILLGLVEIGGINTDDLYFGFNLDAFFLFVGFGLFVPPIIGLLNSIAVNYPGAALLRKANEYIRIYYLIIAWSFTQGILGVIVLHLNNIYDNRILFEAFFLAVGVGFLFAYFIDSQYGRKSE